MEPNATLNDPELLLNMTRPHGGVVGAGYIATMEAPKAALPSVEKIGDALIQRPY